MPSRLFERVAVRTPPARRAAALPLSLALHAAVVAGVLALPVALPVPAPRVLGPIGSPVLARADDTRDRLRVRPEPRRSPRAGTRARSFVRPDPPPATPAPAAPAGQDGPVLTGPIVETASPADGPPPCLTNCGGSPAGAGEPGPGEPDGREVGEASALRPGGDVTPPRRIRYAVPLYPDLARITHVEGTVVLDCTIGLDGRVEDVRVLSGHPLLDPAAVQAVQQWRYTPTRLNGVPVRVLMTVTIRFVLGR